MKKHKTGRTLCSFLLIGMFIITGCRKKEEPFVYNNHIFTKEVVSGVIEIRYGALWDDEHIIIDEKTIEKICRNLASLKLTEISRDLIAYGNWYMKLIKKEGEFSVSLTGEQICMHGEGMFDYKLYSTDKDAMKYVLDEEEDEE